MSIDALTVTWEAIYHDGSFDREKDGVKYAAIDRANLKEFRLVRPGEILVQLFCKKGVTGWNLCYRRRTAMGYGTAGGASHHSWFVLGFVPYGPAIAFDPATNEAHIEHGFKEGDPLLSPPTPRFHEGERFSMTAANHSTDARVAQEIVGLPSGAILNLKGRRSN